MSNIPAHTQGSAIERNYAAFLSSIERRNWERKVFYNPNQVREWMLKCDSPQSANNATKLLAANTSNDFDQIRAEQLQDYMLVFATLVHPEVRLGRYMLSFMRLRFHDKALEHDHINYETLRRLPPDHRPDDASLEAFEKWRWAFVPVNIELHMDHYLPIERVILPFCRRDPVAYKQGGTSTVNCFTIQEDLLSPNVKERIEHSRHFDKEFRWCYKMAVKSYYPGWEDTYDYELQAFKGVDGKQGFVQCLGSYQDARIVSRDDKAAITRHILLEYGEQDLDEYLAEMYPPILHSEILKFWELLFKVADSIEKLHNLKYENQAHVRVNLKGWHGDIKPANILRVNGEFKLADFGFTGFARDQETLEETMIGGTSTYWAPECDSYARGERSGTNSQKMNAQKMDTWSFGCLLSAVATWVILGSQAYDNYTQRRKIAIQKLRHRKAAGEDVSVPSADDAFHDGVRVLPAVTNWHKYLQNSIRKGDTISGLVLEYVDQNLLVADPRERPSFANLTARLRHILAAAKAEYSSMKEKELIPTVDDDTLDALLELDRNAPQQATATYQLAPAQTATIAEETAPVSGSQQLTVPGPRKPGMVSTRVGKSERLSKILRGKIASRDETISETLGKPSAMNADNYQQESGYQRRPEMPTEKPSSEHGNKVKGGARSVAVQVSARDATAQEALHISYGALAPSPQIIVAEPSAGATPRYLEHNQEAVIGNNAVGAHPNPTNTETARRPATIPSISIHPPAIHSPGLDQQPFGSEASKEYGQRPASPMLDGTITSNPPQSPPTDSAGRISVDWPPPIFGEFTAQEEQWMHPTPLDKIRKKYPVSADLKAFINDRDIIFVVDNGPSMARSWRLAKLVVTTLSRKIGPLDDDGLELVFTCGGTAFNKKKIQGWDIRDQFPKQMDKADPAKIQAQGSHPGRETDMNEILRQIFDEYKPKRAKKRLTLIILTDGVWRSSAPDDVENLIASYQRSIEELGKWEKRWFSIGFVAFGSDQNALRRLKDLDETMKTKFKINDVIDTVPWYHRVDKMIIGSMHDGDDDEGEGVDWIAQAAEYEREFLRAELMRHSMYSGSSGNGSVVGSIPATASSSTFPGSLTDLSEPSSGRFSRRLFRSPSQRSRN